MTFCGWHIKLCFFQSPGIFWDCKRSRKLKQKKYGHPFIDVIPVKTGKIEQDRNFTKFHYKLANDRYSNSKNFFHFKDESTLFPLKVVQFGDTSQKICVPAESELYLDQVYPQWRVCVKPHTWDRQNEGWFKMDGGFSIQTYKARSFQQMKPTYQPSCPDLDNYSTTETSV